MGDVELHGDGFVLRPLTVADAPAHKAGEDPEQTRWFEFPGPAPMENVVGAIEAWQDSWAHGGPVRNFGVWDEASGALIGNVEVRDLGDSRANLSYIVFPQWRGGGIATRAARLVLQYAHDELGARTAVIKALPGNAASLGVARALGATEVGTAPSDAGATFVVLEVTLPLASEASGASGAQP